ncbi:tetratricopeptide repeat protein [bacterium]|nr:tetratricopeptide repeat protein [bacterium]
MNRRIGFFSLRVAMGWVALCAVSGRVLAADAPRREVELPLLGGAAAGELTTGVEEHRARAAAASARGDYPAAEGELREAIRFDPNSADIVLELSEVLYAQGKTESALAVLVGYGGADARVRQALAEAYVSMNRYDEAERMFMDLSLRQPSVAQHRYNLGLIESRMGKMDLAENAYLRAVELDPSFSDARYNLALLYIRTRDYPRALAQLEEAVRIRPDPEYLINYAVVLRELNRIPTALAALEQVLAIDPKNALAWNNLGMTHYVAGNKAEAQKAFTKVLESEPSDQIARSFLSRLSLEGSTAPRIPESKPDPKPENAPARPRPPAIANQTAEVKEDVSRIQKENSELKKKLAYLESRMEKLDQDLPRLPAAADEKPAGANKIAQKSPKKDPTAAESRGGEEPESLRLAELRKNLADMRGELDALRRERGIPAFSPEPASTDQRIDAADRAVLTLQQQIRQLVIERDLLRAEVRAIREGGGTILSREAGHTNINVADLNALLIVPGMDERLAHNILWFRQNIGPFKSLMDLKNVPGMDEPHYAQMIDFVTLGPGVTP